MDEGDFNIQSSSQQEGAPEKECCELLRLEMCGGGNGSFVVQVGHEMYFPATVNVFAYVFMYAEVEHTEA